MNINFFGWFTNLFRNAFVIKNPPRSPQREAILLTADFLDKNPELYDFMQGRPSQPTSGEPACALAWIGTFSGKKFKDYHEVAKEFLQLPTPDNCCEPAWTFYDRIEALDDPIKREYCRWMDSPFHLTPLLRKYADRHYPEVG